MSPEEPKLSNREIISKHFPWALGAGLLFHLMTGDVNMFFVGVALVLFFGWLEG